MLPDYVIKTAYERHDLKYIADEDIPESLKSEGWNSTDWIKDLGDETYMVVHLINGPSNDGSIVCKRNDRVIVKNIDVSGEFCTFESEWINPEITEKSDPCDELFSN